MGFNKGGYLHFNLLFYEKLHCRKKSTFVDTYAFWFIVFSHELAHNFVSEHNADHAYISESYSAFYMRKLFEVLSTQVLIRTYIFLTFRE